VPRLLFAGRIPCPVPRLLRRRRACWKRLALTLAQALTQTLAITLP